MKIHSLLGLGQVYNYQVPNLHNLETNPSILSSEKFDQRAKLTHLNSFSSTNPFNYSSFRYSNYLESSFIGYGLTLNRTSYGGGVTHYHAGLGFGYRNVLFNKL